MALDRTSGFDMLVQVSEAELNIQLATAFLGGGVFPQSISVPVNGGGVVGTADLNFQTPTIDLDRPRPKLGLTVPFAMSELVLTSPLPLTVAPLGGTIVIVDAVEIATQGSTQAAVLDFNAGAPDVTVQFDTASQGRLNPLLTAAGLTLVQAQNMMAGMVVTQLQTSIGQLLLTPRIPVVDDASPTTIFDLDVTTITDTSAADRDCLVFGVRMSNEAGGNINNATMNLIPPGSESIVMMSNFWLLAKVMRPTVAAALGRPVTDFDTPLRLNTSIPAPGGTGTLTNLEARIAGNMIQVDGRATASGTGWSAVSTFSFFVSLSIDSTGSIAIATTTPVVNTDVDLEWWVWLVGLALGGLFGGIIGVIVAAIVLAITESVLDGVANSLISSGVSGSLGSFSAIPLGPIGSGLSMTAIVLDDLELRGPITRLPGVPVRNQGGRTTLASMSFDLDAGTTYATEVPGTDLVWDPAHGLTTRGAARLSITGHAFDALTPLQVSALPLTSTGIPVGAIPTKVDVLWMTIGGEVVFGIRTGEGHLAKCRAWRDPLTGGTLHLDWVTYDNPVPQLDLSVVWSVHERGPVTEYISDDCSRCRSSQVAWCCHVEAWPRLMAFPIDYQWTLAGTVLADGDGEVTTATRTLAYTLAGRNLHVRGELGETVDCELCVSAIDARGRELVHSIRLYEPGVQTVCVPCRPHDRTISYADLPHDVAGWRPMLAAATPAKAG